MTPFQALTEAKHYLSHEDADTFEIGGTIIKVMDLKKGDQVVTHCHPYTHAHILGKGSVEIEVNGHTAVYTAPAVIEIIAGQHHGITALEDSTGFCVHAHSLAEAVAFGSN